jgi:hypothetical protein
VAAAASIAASSAYADVIHNDSVMEVVAFPDHINIRYVVPRPILYSVGVHPGTLMLTGAFYGTSFKGTAYVFTHYCGAFPYEVRGGLTADSSLVVDGAEPDVRSDCNVYGYFWGSKSHLVFTEVGLHLAPPPAVVAVPVVPPVVVPPVVVAPNIDNSKTHNGPTTTQEQTNQNNQEVHIHIDMPKDYKGPPPDAQVIKKDRDATPSEKQPN